MQGLTPKQPELVF